MASKISQGERSDNARAPLPPVESYRYRAVVLPAILALSAVLTIHRLGAADVCGFNEAVEGVFAQQMVERGQLLFPLLNGRMPMYKPPLFHWTATAIDMLAGSRRVTAFNLRLPSAFYAIAGVALTILFTLDLFGFPAAVLAGLILCGSYQYIEQARIGRVDMTLCFFETVALFSFVWWLRSHEEWATGLDSAGGRGALRYLVAAALGLAVLAKGPIGAFLPALSMGALLLAERRFSALRAIVAPGPMIVAIVIGSSWYLACYFSGHYGFLNRQIESENLGRFLGALGGMSATYYLRPIFLNSGVISLLVPFAFGFAIWVWASGSSSATLNQPEVGTDNRAAERNILNWASNIAVRLFLIFYIVTVIFFTVAAYKRRAYLLPVWPSAAVVLAWTVEQLEPRRWPRPAAIVICIASIIFNFLYLPRKEIRDCGNDSLRSTAASVNRIVGRDEPLYGYKLGNEPAELVFYLDRDLPPIGGKLGDAPPGYILTSIGVWNREHASALDLTPVFSADSGRPLLVLLRHGRAIAAK